MERHIRIGDALVGDGQPPWIVAEIGAQFSSIDEACARVDAAAACGCDAVKLQTFRAATLVRPGALFTFEDGTRVSQYEFFRARELDREMHVALKARAARHGLTFFSTPSHADDVELLESVGVEVYKIGSDDLTNLAFIEQVARRGRPLILSTGMSTLGEVEEAVRCVRRAGDPPLILLHCLVGYPAPLAAANLRVMATLRHAFGVPVGFSDHTGGTLAALAAACLGAVVIEKHFTLDRTAGGPDNDTALGPAEMTALVRDIRAVVPALGDGIKRIQPVEEKWRAAGRKSLVAACHIPAGRCLTPDLVAVRRPADGLHPRHLGDIVGRVTRGDIEAGACLHWDLLSPLEHR